MGEQDTEGREGGGGRCRVWGPRTAGSEGTGAPLSSDSRHLPFLGLSLLVRKTGSLRRAATQSP